MGRASRPVPQRHDPSDLLVSAGRAGRPVPHAGTCWSRRDLLVWAVRAGRPVPHAGICWSGRDGPGGPYHTLERSHTPGSVQLAVASAFCGRPDCGEEPTSLQLAVRTLLRKSQKSKPLGWATVAVPLETDPLVDHQLKQITLAVGFFMGNRENASKTRCALRHPAELGLCVDLADSCCILEPGLQPQIEIGRNAACPAPLHSSGIAFIATLKAQRTHAHDPTKVVPMSNRLSVW